jgi:hypothetical protein
MSVEKQLNLPVSNFEGAELIVWTHEKCPVNSTAGVDYWDSGSSKVTVKNGKFMRIAQRSDSFAGCDCPKSQCHSDSGASDHGSGGSDYTPTTWVPVTEAELSTDEGISFYSSSLGSGYVSPSSPDTVRVSNHGNLRPNKDGSTSKQLICFRGCIDGAKLATAISQNEAQFDDVWPSTRASAHMYTFDEQTGILTDSNGITIMKEEGTSQFYMTLLEATTATFTELECADSDTTECLNPQGASTIYRWQTGSEWSSITFLTDETGTVRAPMRQIELKIVIPKSYDPRTLSGLSYAGKTILVDYQNGWISGLPIVCQDEQTMTYREADYETHDGIMHGRCNYNANEREVSDFLLPRGVIAVSENIFAGTKTEYVLKPTWVRQKLKNTSPGDCSGIAGPPTGTPLPSMDLFGTMRMPPRPTTAEVKVEGGTIMVTA